MALTKIDSAMIAEGAIDSGKIANTVALGGPKITGLDYPGDDTAAVPAGGQTIIVAGSGFASGCAVFIDGVAVGVVSFLSETQLQFVAPAKATGLYTMYVVNPDGGTAILVPGMVYSGTPTWTTASGSIGTPYETTAVSINLAATGDGALTYVLTSGSSLPAGLSLSSGGAITGTVPATAADTTYTFNVDVIDAENQSTTRQFSLTYRTDVITWSSPAAGASFTWVTNQANSTSLTATSAAGKSVSFSVQSGSLPTGVSVSGSNIAGTPTAVQANTSVVIRATAADTARYADRTFYYTAVAQEEPYWNNTSLLLNFNGSNNSTTFVDSSPNNLAITLASGTVTNSTTVKKFGSASGYFAGPYNYLTVANSSGFTFGTQDFTIEAWVYKTANENYPQGIVMWRPDSWFFAFNNDYGVMAQVHVGAGYGITAHGKPNGFTFELNRWYHIAMVRNGNTVYSYIDGQQASSGALNNYGSDTNVVNTGTLSIGSYGSGAGQYGFQGYIDDIRITKGVARYAIAGFTPPTSELGRYL